MGIYGKWGRQLAAAFVGASFLLTLSVAQAGAALDAVHEKGGLIVCGAKRPSSSAKPSPPEQSQPSSTKGG